MKIQIDLPVHDNTGYGELHADGFDNTPDLCPVCEYELNGLTARLHPLGYVHAALQEGDTGPTCLDKAIEKLLADPRNAWITIAEHIAKAPSKHPAATIRAALTTLARIARNA